MVAGHRTGFLGVSGRREGWQSSLWRRLRTSSPAVVADGAPCRGRGQGRARHGILGAAVAVADAVPVQWRRRRRRWRQRQAEVVGTTVFGLHVGGTTMSLFRSSCAGACGRRGGWSCGGVGCVSRAGAAVSEDWDKNERRIGRCAGTAENRIDQSPKATACDETSVDETGARCARQPS